VEKWISLSFTWSGISFTLEIAHSDRLDGLQRDVGRNAYGSQRIFDLKAALFSMTDVPPERQKILGLVKGKLPPEDGRM
jgi:ubiquitin-like domain-containing CTD phosphatase 1